MSEITSNTLLKILDKNNNCDDKEIRKIMHYYINKVRNKSYFMNFDVDTIGYKSDINREYEYIKDLNEIKELKVSGTSFWNGFIPKDIKIVYYFEIKKFLIANYGYYYYIDNYDYIYDFLKYIKGKKISNDFSFIVTVYEFLRKYFLTINKYLSREQIHHLIYNSNNIFYPPIKEHSITDFKNNGAAECSEFAALFQNILSVFGYESIYIHGEVDDFEKKNSSHAYNLSIANNEFTLVDTSMPIVCYNHDERTKIPYPFVYTMNNFNEKGLEDFLLGNKEIELEDLEAHIINKHCYTFCKTKKRVYRVDQMTFDD